MEESPIIVVLGLDGLDYDLTRKWQLKNLLQVQHGKVTVPIDRRKQVPLSPTVWATFLCGKYVEASFKRQDLPIPLWKKVMYKTLGKKTPQYNVGMEGLHESTFLDVVPSCPINVPFINCDYLNYALLHKFAQKQLSLEETIFESRKLYMENQQRILEGVKNCGDGVLVFGYMPYPDDFEHLAYKDTKLIKQVYHDLDLYATQVSQYCDCLVVVSDHGFDLERGTHSKYGFYSSSKPFNPKPTRIMDFYQLLLKEATYSTAKNDKNI